MNKYACSFWRKIDGKWRQELEYVVAGSEAQAAILSSEKFWERRLNVTLTEIIVRYVSTVFGTEIL